MHKKIGWIGAGIMGVPMCEHLIDAGYQLYVFDNLPKKIERLISKGAKECSSPLELAECCDVVCSMVGSPDDVRNIMFGETGIFLSLKENSLLIDFTSSSPELAQDIARKANVIGAYALDAPVTGGEQGAKAKTLSIMVGGDPKGFEMAKPLFDLLGKTVTYMGKPGSGQHTKISGQILGASTILGVVESLIYCKKAKLDMHKVISVLEKGAVGSQLYSGLGPKIVDDDFDPGFAIKHFLKDMGIALGESERMDLSLPGLSLVRQLYIASGALGIREQGIQGLYNVLQQLNNLDPCLERDTETK